MPNTNNINKLTRLLFEQEVARLDETQKEVKKLIQSTFSMFSNENIDFLLKQTLHIIDAKQFLNNALTLDDLSELLSEPIAEITQYSTPEERSDFSKAAIRNQSRINHLHKNSHILTPKVDKNILQQKVRD